MNTEIINIIRSVVRRYVDDAEIFLFGSRARGDFRDTSDWDVLVIVKDAAGRDLSNAIDYELWNEGLDHGEQINTIVRTRSQWKNNVSLFKKHVIAEGIRL